MTKPIYCFSFSWLPALAFALLVSENCTATPFQNLDFEQGFSGQNAPHAIPGWRSTLPTENTFCFDPGCGSLTSAEYPSVESMVISGAYSVALNASSFGIVGGAAQIIQNGALPDSAKSLRILVGDWTSYQRTETQSGTQPISAVQGLRITINDHEIPMSQIEDLGNGIGIIAGNIAEFAGQNVELRIGATTRNILGSPQFPSDSSTPSIILVAGTATVGGLIDDIVFSPIAVPEPHSLLLLGLLGGILLRRRCVCQLAHSR